MSEPQLSHDDSASGERGDSSGRLDETERHEVLSNERRRRVLELLHDRTPRELSVLAEEVAAAETDQRPPPRNKRNSVYITLHQTHLPKLDGLDIVEYDDREKVVTLGPRADQILGEADDGDATGETVPWTGVYAVLVGLGLSVSGGSELGVPPFGAVSSGTVAVATLVVLMTVLAYRVGADGLGLPGPLRDRFE